jgi:hypothetical protein
MNMMWLMLCKLARKVTVTLAAPDTVHVVPEADLHPAQPPNVKPEPGAALKVMVGALVKVDSHVPVVAPGPALVQLMPLGLLVTTPVPPPAVFTVT